VAKAVKVFEKNTTAVFYFIRNEVNLRWRFFSKPIGLDLYSLMRLVEVAVYFCYLFFIYNIITSAKKLVDYFFLILNCIVDKNLIL